MDFSRIFWNFCRNWGIYDINTCYKNFRHYFCCIATIKMLKLLRSFQNILFITKTPSLNRNEKVTCENCGVQITKYNLDRHKKSCSAGTLYCSNCPNFFTKLRDDLNNHIAKQHSAAGPSKTYKCRLCYAEFPDFYALRQHKNTQHGTQIGFRARNIDVEDIVGDVDGQSLREELQSYRHFLDDSEIQNGRHSVLNFAVNNFTAQVIEEKFGLRSG